MSEPQRKIKSNAWAIFWVCHFLVISFAVSFRNVGFQLRISTERWREENERTHIVRSKEKSHFGNMYVYSKHVVFGPHNVCAIVMYRRTQYALDGCRHTYSTPRTIESIQIELCRGARQCERVTTSLVRTLIVRAKSINAKQMMDMRVRGVKSVNPKRTAADVWNSEGCFDKSVQHLEIGIWNADTWCHLN